eukprot:CAMPEP_0181408806 /NCGR_PEP_ID=MMETSP1110-20121109/6491_1 /TAXON_ID=174948 /ORGANISM="Symbiodinium sp., Strain CCMP421" /LENGTH=735 /DNA_ID=CAMNT_0023531289 /DNA_START=46 /DNA_END=2256 /DNA_ORIENTATION=+
MARICRASFSAERDVELVIVDADAVDRSKASQFPSHAQHLLEMVNCRDCEKEWPFEAVMGIEPLLEQVEGGSGDVTYLCWQYNGQDLHAVGLGSNKKQRKQAALLALVLARLLLTCHDMPPELAEYLRQLAARPVRKLLLRPGAAPAIQPSQGQWEEADGASQWEAREPWLPVSGSWVWWYDRTTLVILCEDDLARIFADAKTWFYEAAGVSQEPERDDLPRSVNQDFQRIFPDVFFTDRFRHKGHSVIGVGRDVKHRTRAGCLGLAALFQKTAGTLPQPRQRVMDEIFHSEWFPQEPIQRFYDMQSWGFWQNMEMWAEGQPEQEFSKPTVNEIRMNCQPAMLKALEQKWWVEIDLTNSGRPWRGIIKGHKEEKSIFRFTRPGITRFAIAADWNKRDPYQETPLIYFVAETGDGHVHTFHTLDRTDETMLKEVSRKDQILAYRHAAGWEVKKRWQAFEENVFQNLIRDFEATERQNGYWDTDFQPPAAAPSLYAWRLSTELQATFQKWLATHRSRCESVEEVRSHCGDEAMRDTLDSAVQGLFQEFEVRPADWPSTVPGNAAARRPRTFSPLQKSMLESILAENSGAIRGLDPSRSPDAERRFQWEWCWASEDIRFGHAKVSDHFIHGKGSGRSLDSLVEELVDGSTRSEDIPALVAVRHLGLRLVVCGNRRLRCFKEALLRGRDCKFKVITHPFPSLHTVENISQRFALVAKALVAVDNVDGKNVQVRPKRRRM